MLTMLLLFGTGVPALTPPTPARAEMRQVPVSVAAPPSLPLTSGLPTDPFAPGANGDPVRNLRDTGRARNRKDRKRKRP